MHRRNIDFPSLFNGNIITGAVRVSNDPSASVTSCLLEKVFRKIGRIFGNCDKLYLFLLNGKAHVLIKEKITRKITFFI